MHSHKLTTPKGRTLEASHPFDQALAMSGNTWEIGEQFETVVKGAPEKLIARSEWKSSDKHAAEIALHLLTVLGYRVIGLARVRHERKLPETLSDLDSQTMEFMGLLAVADELRPEATEAIRQARAAGITVRMITGDHAETAYAIGKELASSSAANRCWIAATSTR